MDSVICIMYIINLSNNKNKKIAIFNMNPKICKRNKVIVVSLYYLQKLKYILPNYPYYNNMNRYIIHDKGYCKVLNYLLNNTNPNTNTHVI